MGQTASELRADIEQRRENMSGTVEAIEDRVLPGRIIRRRRDAARGWVDRARSRVMGENGGGSARRGVSDLASGATSGAQSLAHGVSEMPEQLSERTRGAPLVAGGIAFGVGALVALVLPETDPERRAAEALEPQVAAATDAAMEAGRRTLDAAKGSAQSAAGDLKEQATEHAEEASSDVKDAAARVSQTAKDGAEEIRR